MAEDEVTQDAFLGGLVTVFQPRRGFRAGTDSMLLAAALDPTMTGDAAEFGCGAGGALLPAAHRLQHMRFTGYERDIRLAGLARRGVEANGFEDRMSIELQDVAELSDALENRFDLCFSNPPFFRGGSITSPGEGKQDAYLETVPLKDWIGRMMHVLKPKGRFVMIHRASELARILTLIERRSGQIEVLPVRSWPGADAKRVIVRARKGLRSGPMRLLAGINIYKAKGGERTELLESISRSDALLDWDSPRQ
ncbi:tRNA1(Val) (adenine(37)-N6)-methyltransferase [Henriciella marina]|uniref:tRNA1(Val) (adenine(37)-N6)-methyltransferase n=1 Tax=Henriciella marina TaxID=453851 RepID=UPI0003667C32|nr:methyltransferase [Henriciella marina]